MTRAGIAKLVLSLAVAPVILSFAACSPAYTPQRTPGMLSATMPSVQGRKIIPGEADNYQEWLQGSPNLVDDMPWRMSTISKSTSALTPQRAATTMSTPVGRIQMQQDYPPYPANR